MHRHLASSRQAPPAPTNGGVLVVSTWGTQNFPEFPISLIFSFPNFPKFPRISPNVCVSGDFPLPGNSSSPASPYACNVPGELRAICKTTFSQCKRSPPRSGRHEMGLGPDPIPWGKWLGGYSVGRWGTERGAGAGGDTTTYPPSLLVTFVAWARPFLSM